MIFIQLILALVFGSASASALPDSLSGGLKAYITKVQDGDTVYVDISRSERAARKYLCETAPQKIKRNIKNCDKPDARLNTKVRFLRIDTPESFFNGKSQGDLGNLAKEELIDILGGSENVRGTEVTLQFGSTAAGKYGRILAEIVLKEGNLNVNLELVRRGWAFPFFFAPDHEDFPGIYDEYIAVANTAIDEGRGLYAAIYASNPNNLVPHEFRLKTSGEPEASAYILDRRSRTKIEYPATPEGFQFGSVGVLSNQAKWKARIQRVFFP